jgi:replicative DNA helicase
VEQKAKLRQLITACSEINEAAYAQNEEVAKILDMAESKIYEIMQSRQSTELTHIRSAIVEAYDALSERCENRGSIQGVPTHFSALDQYLLGLGKGDLVLIAARPGMGKTAFALNIAENVARGGKDKATRAANKDHKTIAVFSLEMSNEQLVNRLLSSASGVMNTKFRSGELDSNEWRAINQAAELLSRTDIYLDDTPGITVPQIKAKLRRLKNLDLVIIDYLQLMESAKKTDGRTQEVSEISRSLKLMAKEFGIPVIALSQLSRGPESRPDKRPQMSDLRESGAIEQDADIIMMLYRDDYYNKENSQTPGICECIITKNRHGSSGTVQLHWSGENTRFSDLEQRYE